MRIKNPLTSLGNDPSRILRLFNKNYKCFVRTMFEVFGENGVVVAQKLAHNRQNELYKSFPVFKKRGKPKARTVYSPTDILKFIQKDLEKLFRLQFSPNSISHGFEPGRSTATAAKEILNTDHLNEKVATNIDIAGAFPAIQGKAIRKLLRHHFRTTKLNNWQINIISKTVVTSNDRLAIGAPTSPTLFNWRLTSLDAQLVEVAAKRGWKIIRYADDITIIHYRTQKKEAVELLSRMLRKYDLELAREKLRSFRGSLKKILGINVQHGKLSIPRKIRNTRRALAHMLKDYGISSKNNYTKDELFGIIKTLPYELRYTKESLEAQLAGFCAYSIGIIKKANEINLHI